MENLKLIRWPLWYRVFCPRCGIALEIGEQHPCQMPVVDRVEAEEKEMVAA